MNPETEDRPNDAKSGASSRARRFAVNLTMAATSVVVALLLAEIVFRVAEVGEPAPEIWQQDPQAFIPVDDPDLVFMFRPGLKSRVANAPTEINALGMRDEDIPPTKPAGEFRILMLGDSVTFGLSVSLEATFAKAMESHLNASGSTYTFRVYNAGVPSYNTTQEYRFLERLVEPVRPDLVVLNFTLSNDWETPYDLPESGYITPTAVRPGEFLVPVPLEKSLGKISNVYRFLIRQYRRKKLAPKRKEHLERIFRIYREEAEGWQRSKAGLLGMYNLLRPRGIGFGVFIYPEPTDRPAYTREDYPFLEIHQKVEDFCESHGIAYLDLLDDFLRWRNKKELYVAPTDAHPSPMAHELVARGLIRELRERDMLPAKGAGSP